MKAWFKENLGLFITLVITTFYLIGIICITDLSVYKELKLNEKGDFLAGVFSPLAFLWLVFGYFQQGQELKLNTQALKMQADELVISNTSLKKQVEEMEKSVKAQQEMFELAERQYSESRDEKIKLSTPQIRLTGSKYKKVDPYLSGNFIHQFNLTIKVENLTIKNLKLSMSGWCVAKSGGSMNNSMTLDINSIDANRSEVLMIYKRTNHAPFNNDHLYLSYYDEYGVKYQNTYEFTKTEDSIVVLKEKF
ncbi:MAG: hypothetical protein O2793_16815 [Proteobacteria bacterium]|nr:hypothetical protein [Pseudomonadota bacterium]MDA1256017.1 hypothetical protein [Pseudomonadota bacterium]